MIKTPAPRDVERSIPDDIDGWIDTDFSWNWIGQAFFVRFRKTQGAKLKTFFKTQGSKLKVFSKNSMYRRFFNDFFGKKKNHFVANFVCKTQKFC